MLGGVEVKNSIEYYFPDSPWNNRLSEQTMITGREGHVSVVMADGRVLTAGGNNGTGLLPSMELFDLRSGQVTAGRDMTTARYDAAAALIDDSVYVCGGYDRTSWLSSCEKSRLGRWTGIAAMNQMRPGLAMVTVDQKLFAFGGYNGRRYFLSSVERYDRESNRWEMVSPMPTNRSNPGAAVFNGWIYVCGGWNGTNALSVCESYDQTRDQWQTVAPMMETRSDLSLVVLNERLYALGGGGWKSVEVYDVNKNEWTLLPQKLIEGRWSASAVAVLL